MSRYRLHPTPAQQAVLRDHCGHARYIWNLAAEQHSHWHPGRRNAPGYLEQSRQLTAARAENPWLAAGSQTVQQQALRDFPTVPWPNPLTVPQEAHCQVIFGTVDLQDGQDATPGIRDVRICGSQLVLRALRPREIDEAWQAMVTAAPGVIAEVPDEASFKARLQRSGHLEHGWLDLAIDLDGVSIGRIQTFVPPGRPLSPGTFDVGIDLRDDARGRGYGREALALFTDWLFERAGAEVIEASTDPANVAMRTVFQRVGWQLAGSLTEFGREWVMYRTTRLEWKTR
jgi:RimJ/RimL family protein N-acetyltransferase